MQETFTLDKFLNNKNIETLNCLNYSIILVNINSFSEINLLHTKDKSIEDIQSHISMLLYSALDKTFQHFKINSINENEIIFLLATNNKETTLTEKLEEISQKILNLNDINITISKGKNFKKLDMIPITIQLMRTTIKNNLIFGKSSSIDCTKTHIYLYKDRDFIDSTLLKKLNTYLDNGNILGIQEDLDILLLKFKDMSATQFEIQKTLKRLLNNSYDSLFSKTTLCTDILIDDMLIHSKTYTDLSSNLNLLIENLFFEHLKIFRKKDTTKEFVLIIKTYIENNISENINITSVAQKFAVSTPYLSKIFKKELGISPIVYLNKIKIERACHLIETSDLSIREISEICGYTNQFYFSKNFKEAYGISPSIYKQNFKNTKNKKLHIL